MPATLDLWASLPAAVIPYAAPNAPTGWLLCDGQAVSRTTYATLFSLIGTTYGAGDGSTTFNVPDLRGEFIRGLDRGRGVDTGRVLGSAQQDALQNITGTMSNVAFSGGSTTTTGAINAGANLGSTYAAGSSGNVRDISFDASRVARTATETRPRNVAMNYIIKT